MTLRMYRNSVPAAMTAATHAADQLRALQGGAGDLPFSQIETVQRALGRSKVTALAAITDLSTASQESTAEAAEAETFLANYGGPASIADFQSHLASIDTAAGDWAARLKAAVREVSTTAATSGIYFVDIEPRDFSGTQIKMVSYFDRMTSAIATPLRASSELAALIAAFEAAGA